jgi:aromatic ring-opening dioxygenase catalytic subunit (LigB family)
MAKFVGAFAASHGPLLVRDWDIIAPDRRDRITAAFRALGRRVVESRVDVLVLVAPDHWVNFFLDNMPNVCIGIGAAHAGPPEPFMKAFPHRLEGAPEFANHILRTALESDFEPSVSHRLTLDHGACIPLWRMELPELPRLVPFIVNVIEPPMPNVNRCLAWGRLLARAVESYPEDLRIGLLATGGLSHSIGEPTMGAIDERFDREFLRLLASADEPALVEFLAAELPRAGNGTDEVRNWLVAHGMAGGRGFDLISYMATPEVYVGCGWGAWRTN